VLPSTCTTQFQAAQACRLSGKRLLTNNEWQDAASGTPDSGVDDGATLCDIGPGGDPSPTGSRASCVSKWGASDMVGNVWEWVADWGDLANDCDTWSAGFGSDIACVGGAPGPGSDFDNFPGALFRGGSWSDGSDAGVFAVGAVVPSFARNDFGFRCGR
jgi:formylglycine-generating enzyme required for sulfatase activity